ncbi:HAD family acid phosphatase [Francisellaceae bacterium CB300]
MTKQQIIDYYESDEHEKEVASILSRAKEIISSADSLENKVVVFDIDETSLNHYRALKDYDFPQGDNHKVWDECIFVTAGKPIQATLDFYKFCLAKDLKVFFVSARVADSLEATKLALKDAGYTKFEDVFVFPKEITNYNPKQFSNFKAERRAYIESLGYKILLSVGDQPSDLIGGFTQYTFELPNYLYGKKSFNKPI